jgi:hypothetical protein
LRTADPTPFLTALLAKPYRTRVMLAPHALGPTSGAPAAATNTQQPAALAPAAAAADATAEATKILDNSFNKLTSIGFCAAKECQRFPVALPAGRQPAQLQPGAPADVEAFAAHLQEQGQGQGQGQAAMQQPPGNWLLWDFAADTPAGDDDSSTEQPGGTVAKQPDGRKLAAAADLRPVAGSPETSTGHNNADEDSRRAFAYATGGAGSVLIIDDAAV